MMTNTSTFDTAATSNMWIESKQFLFALVLSASSGLATAVPTFPPGWEQSENCGPAVERPGKLESLFSKDKVAAFEKSEACTQRNRDRDERNIARNTKMLEGIVYNTRESCKQAVRKLAAAPSTLSFDYGKPFSYTGGLNASGVDTTDGGYSVNISGTAVGGAFAVKCYMDERFNITSIR